MRTIFLICLSFVTYINYGQEKDTLTLNSPFEKTILIRSHDNNYQIFKGRKREKLVKENIQHSYVYKFRHKYNRILDDAGQDTLATFFKYGKLKHTLFIKNKPYTLEVSKRADAVSVYDDQKAKVMEMNIFIKDNLIKKIFVTHIQESEHTDLLISYSTYYVTDKYYTRKNRTFRIILAIAFPLFTSLVGASV